MGDSESSRRHPPHVDENMKDAPLQEDHPSPDDVGSLPATAHGQDKESTDTMTQPIDPASMYDGRPEESKHWDPTEK